MEKTVAEMKSALIVHLHAIADDGEELPEPGGIAAYLEAVSASEGEEYFLTHIPVDEVLPQKVPA